MITKSSVQHLFNKEILMEEVPEEQNMYKYETEKL